MKYKIIAGTGHRPDKWVPTGYTHYWDRDLPRAIELAKAVIQRHEPDKVISGMAQGWDTALAMGAIELGVSLTAAVPGPWFPNCWPDKAQDYYRSILAQASKVYYMTQERPIIRAGLVVTDYHVGYLNIRNHWMTDNTEAFTALHNGSRGGTWNNIQDANDKGKPVHNYWGAWVNRRGF